MDVRPDATLRSDTCECFYVDEAAVAAVSAQMPALDDVGMMAETFKLLADPTRLRIIHALSLGELCVCDLATMLGVGRTAISNHLRLLRGMRLVRYRRDGKIAYYSLSDEHITRLIAESLEHVKDL